MGDACSACPGKVGDATVDSGAQNRRNKAKTGGYYQIIVNISKPKQIHIIMTIFIFI